MRFATFSNKGTVTEPEDGLFAKNPFFAVLDGSGAYEPAGKIRYRNQSSGQAVRDLVRKEFSLLKPKKPLRDLMLAINRKVGLFQKNKMNVRLERSDLLAGVCLAAIKVGPNSIECAQAGDCYILWVSKKDQPAITPNQSFLCEKAELKIIRKLMIKHSGDRKKMWQDFAPELAASRLKRVNKKVRDGYGFLNGQTEFAQCLNSFSLTRNKVRNILLFSDGLAYFPDTKNPKTLTNKVWALYKKGGFRAVLQNTRDKQKKHVGRSYVDYDEATAIAISL